MNDIIYNYILQGVLGAASGYITNDYAINMLFKEYTPFKIGGVIKKTRNEFIDNISSLVENDIINKEKLNSILCDEAFITKFEAITEDFFKNCLYESSGFDTVSEIKSMDSTVEKTRVFLNVILDKHINEVTDLLLQSFNPHNFLNDCQLNKITESLFDTVYNCLSDTDMINDFIKSIYTEKGNINFSELLGEKEQVLDDLTCKITARIKETIKCNDKIFDDVNEIIDSVDLRASISSIKNMYADKSVRDLIKTDPELNEKLTKLFTDYINSEKGQTIISDICKSIFSYAENNEKTLYEIIDSSFEINLKSYLMKNLPDFTKNVVEWVNLNSKNIDKLIEDSIDEVIKESDGMKGKLLSTIRNSYLINLGEKYNIVQKIVEFIEKETEPEKLSNNISSTIIEYLGSYSLGSIFKTLEDNHIISNEKIVSLITEYINNNSKAVFNEAFNYIKNVKIKDIIPDSISMENVIKNKLYRLIGENILTSHKINKVISEKIISSVKKYVGKNVNEIFPEQVTLEKTPQIKDFIVNSIGNNSTSIKNLIKNELKSASNKTDLYNSFDLKNLISAEIIKKYNSFTDDFENKKFSVAIDKINSIDNLYKNSSESLRSLIIDNLDTILNGSIKAIVYENLNKLNDDELCDFANDFIGKELQPIMYFGGILGLTIGLLLAVVQNAPPDLGGLTVANMITYAFVGYLTNVIAINMIFKPYNEIKAFRKIPFLRHFAQGYIVKNKNVFAKTTAHFVDNNLLSKESINEIFEKYEDSIKNSFNSGISSNDFFLLHKMLTNNHESIVAGSCKFTKNLIEKNIENISNLAFDGIDKIKFSSLLSPENISYMSDLGERKIKNANSVISEYIITTLHSSETLENKIPDSMKKSAEHALNNAVKKYYDNVCYTLGDEMRLKSFFMNYNHKYMNFTNKSASEIFSTSQLDKFGSFVSDKCTDIILSVNSRQKAFDLIETLFCKAFDKDKTFGELFNGKLKEYICVNIPSLFDRLESSAKKSIINAKGIVSIKVQAEIVNNLGFLEKGMYSLMGGKDIVDELINKIMVEKAPKFIEEKRYELMNIFSYTIVESFFNLKVDALHQSIDKLKINDLVNSYFSNDENVDFIKEKVDLTTVSLTKRLAAVKLKDILKVVSLNDIESIFNSYETEINEFSKNLCSNMTVNKEDIIHKACELINKIIADFASSASLNDLCKDISEEDIEAILVTIEDYLSKDDYIKKSIENLLISYRQFMEGRNLSAFISKNEFIESTKDYIDDLLKRNENEDALKRIFSSILIEATNENFSFIHDDTKSYFINVFVESSVKSIRRNLSEMLKSIEFDRIAQEEIEAMEPRKIHEMFDSFAGKYFKRLMLYGFGGFIFGINMYIGLSLTGLKIIKERFFKDK